MGDPGRQQQPVSRIALHISCNSLLNKDFGSKSDPCCALYVCDPQGVWFEVGRTEVVKNCLDPKFVKSFEVDYYFEQVQKVRFMVYDVDNASDSLNDDDFLGSFECTLGEAASKSPLSGALVRKGGKVAGKSSITVTVREMGVSQVSLSLLFNAKHLDKKDFMGKSDPFLVLHCCMPDGSWVAVHQTEVVKNNLNPVWKEFEVSTNKLSSADPNQPIKIDCYDYDSDGSHDLIGSFQTSINQLTSAAPGMQLEWQCVNPKKTSKKGYCNSGMVYLESCRSQRTFTFLDFILAGLQLNFSVAVDFTGSNGNPRDPNSLHYHHPSHPNQYISAIQAVGTVLQDYDSDQLYPGLGFGARIPPNNEVSHCFPLNFQADNPFCKGVEGILESYSSCISQVTLYGPTNFSPVIQHVSQFAGAACREMSARNYYILMVITDGEITDMGATISTLVHASTLPLSVVIIGVGDSDFSSMQELDSDDHPLTDRYGNVAKRDVVQFVAIRDFDKSAPGLLAGHVLGEIPKQVYEYHRMYNIVPGAGVVKMAPPTDQVAPTNELAPPTQ